ncbi:flagellar hook-length control protein FliK [Roseibium salinum]|uniref:flagellar hook-length control protein FliK n=1 Tax=Roseibium salinum TaxID=1604349 RepID=UPI00360A383F
MLLPTSRPETPPADAPAARSGKSLEALLKKDEMPLAALLPMITDISPGQVFQAGGPVPGTKFATASVQDGSLADLLASLGLSGSAPPDAEAGEELPVPDLGEGGDIPADGAAGELAGQEGETELPVDLPVDDGVVQLPVPGPVMGEAPGSVDPAAPADGAVSSGGSEEGPEQVVAPLDPQLVAGQASDAAMPPAPAVPPVDAPPDPLLTPAPQVSGEELLASASTQRAAAEAAPQPVMNNERRWKSELPKELRAPELTLSAAASGSGAGDGEVGAMKTAEGQAQGSPPETQKPVTGIERALLAASQASDAAIAALTREKGGPADPARGQRQAAAQPDQAGGDVAAGLAAKQAGNGLVKPVGASAAPVGFGDGASMPVQDDALRADLAADGDAIEAADDAPRDRPGTKTPGIDANRPVPAGMAARPDAALADKPAGAVPLAASAIAASQVIDEDADLPSSISDLTLSGEIGTTTVRGGEIGASMRTDSLQTPNQTQSAHLASQVAAEIARNLKNGHTRFQMRFDPPELGRVEVNMKVSSDGSVHAHLIVERPETLDMFMRDQRGLERALEAAGLNADPDNLQFSLRQDSGRQFGSGGDQPEQGLAGGPDGAEAGAEADPVLEEIVRMTLAQQRGGLDMKV